MIRKKIQIGTNIYNGLGKVNGYEIRRTIVSAIYLITMSITMSFAVIFVNDRLPDREKYQPLPDLILDNIVYVPWGTKVVEICILLGLAMYGGILAFHKQRLVIFRRMNLLLGTMFLFRSVCTLVTSIPVSDVNDKCHAYPNADIWNRTKRALEFWPSLGMTIIATPPCGDYIFSGHTLTLTMLNLFINEYTPMKGLHIVSWVCNIIGMVFLLLCRSHYTVDVILAFYISIQFFSYCHTLIRHRTVTNKEKKRSWLLVPLLLLLEEESYDKSLNLDGQDFR